MTERSYDRPISLKKAVDMQIVGENILDVADFAIEKYEFENDATLSDQVREEAVERVREDLWDLVKEFPCPAQGVAPDHVPDRRQGREEGGRRFLASARPAGAAPRRGPPREDVGAVS